LKNRIIKIIETWANKEGNINSIEEILEWIRSLNEKTEVSIKECSIDESTFWFYDDYNGEVLNRKRSFFSIKGIQKFENDILVLEQPIIVQAEIGYLGIICKEIDGIMNFLMQAKIEPGNVNHVQISPTIQATKSNFTRVHGGKLPQYFEYFENSHKHNVLLDQIQSEQGARFYKKRNRNMIIEVTEDIEVLLNYKWMTLGQLKELMKIDNLVNMDTRTVISGIPLITMKYSVSELAYIETLFKDKGFFRSIFYGDSSESLINIFQYINNYKMFHESKLISIPLSHLTNWKIENNGITCKNPADFMVKYYDISIHGREVKNWMQPLFKANGKAVLGLITCQVEGITNYLVSARPEIGSFDKIELGPSVQIETTHKESDDDFVQLLFRKALQDRNTVKLDVLMSEEGGRFYHEENRNVVLEVSKGSLRVLPKGYFLVDYSTLNYLIQVNNCLNIQLRNLLSLLEV